MGIYAKIRETVTEAAIFGMAPLFARFLGFFLTFVYTANLSTDQFGQFALLMTTEAFATQLLGFGLTTSYFRSYFDDANEDRRRLITSTTVWFLLAANLGFVLLAAPFAGLYGTLLFGDPYADLVLLMLVMTALDTLNSVPFLILKASRRSKLYVTISWVSGIVQFLLIVLLVAVLELGVEGAMLGVLLGTAFQSVAYFVCLRKHIAFEFSAAELRPLLALGFPMMFNALATKILIASDRFFVNYYHGQSAVGLYAFADRFAAILPILIANPFSLVWPAMRFQVMKDDDAREYYARVLTYLTFLALFFGLGIAALAPDVIRIFSGRGWLGGEYLGAMHIVPVLVLFYVLQATNKGINVGLMIERKAHWNVVIVLTTAAVNFGLNILLIPAYGVMGAAWATVLAYLFFNWFRWYMSNRFYPIPYEWGRIVKLVAVAFALYGATQLVAFANPYLSFAGRFALAATYPFALAVLGFYDARERVRFAQLWMQGRSRAGRVLPFLRPRPEVRGGGTGFDR
jgi:O-antigen/teichoic acid export membrane protein